ncbi:hypothetical protein CSB45_01465 [candidate division KSB3 bacterium]|uniref:SurA N-terminal domain-containing protein n=1 Tax=candidate division KSB3 bacterium TaxID=2044937 RepID=A0A2G6EB77_9BACT|nr:MAG: hypothetical protein CSB45_01465 [candidate division KSB3 bacterium]PIE30736.1 MAG: hypothetical protein CSA57_01885 [candidate division KSB3 bacterium]
MQKSNIPSIKRRFAGSALIVILLLASLTAEAELIEKIVAILDGELILLSDIQQELENPVAQVLADFDENSLQEEDVLTYVIERKLLQQEIQYLAAPKEKTLTKTIVLEYISKTFGHRTLEDLQQKLLTHRISDRDLEEELRLYMKGINYIRRKFRFKADIDNPDIVLKLFQKWLEDLKAKATIQVLDTDGRSL